MGTDWDSRRKIRFIIVGSEKLLRCWTAEGKNRGRYQKRSWSKAQLGTAPDCFFASSQFLAWESPNCLLRHTAYFYRIFTGM